jgi:hypothetical protein
VSNGWTGLSFAFTNSGWDSVGPSSFQINLQTGVSNTSCTTKKDSYFTVSASSGIVSIPFTAFSGANLYNIMSISFEGLGPARTSSGGSVAPYAFGPISFVCSAYTTT